MKKRILALTAVLLICIAAACPAFAQELPETRLLPRLVDNADILFDYEEDDLLTKLDSISENLQCDVVVVTTDSLDDKTPEAYADDFFDYNGYGFGENHDGILLMVCMSTRDWHISTTGFGITAFTDVGLEYISEKFLSDLSDGNYSDAFHIFADECEKFIIQAQTGEPYDVGNLPREPLSLLWIPGSVLIGLLPASLVTKNMKDQLRPVRVQLPSMRYAAVQDNSFVRNSNEVYIGHDVTRTPIASSSGSRSGGGSSTHRSSSGRSHGGRGGKF